MKMKILLLTLLFCLHDLGAAAEGYLDKVRNAGYNSIFVAKILSAETVITRENGSDCYYKYKSVITRSIQGRMVSVSFDFSSDQGLTVGSQYVLLFSKKDDLLHRVRNYGEETQCEKEMTGYYLLHYEIHKVDQLDDGKRLLFYVHFSDVLADLSDVPSQYEMNKDALYIQLDYAAGRMARANNHVPAMQP
jgi:hypothetical protein